MFNNVLNAIYELSTMTWRIRSETNYRDDMQSKRPAGANHGTFVTYRSREGVRKEISYRDATESHPKFLLISCREDDLKLPKQT